MRFKGCPVNVGDRVTAHIKSSDQLMRDGWEPTSSGGLQKSTAYYRFNKKKREMIGKMITGTIALNPKRKLCITDENGWGYDESMVSSFVITNRHEYRQFEQECENIKFVSQNDGGLVVEYFDHDYDEWRENYLNESETRTLIQNLLKFHRWVD